MAILRFECVMIVVAIALAVKKALINVFHVKMEHFSKKILIFVYYNKNALLKHLVNHFCWLILL